MTTRRRWLWIGAALALVGAVIALLLWLNWDWDYGEMKARYDKVMVGMQLEEAEAILGLQPVAETPRWDTYTGPESLAEESVQSGPWDSERKRE